MTNFIPSPRTRYPIDARAERILAAAIDEFVHRGFAAAREHVIARRAGVAPQTLKDFYPRKEELLRDILLAMQSQKALRAA